MTQLINDILKLSVSERINMVETIWDSLAESKENIKLSPQTKELLDQRLEDHRKNPNEGSSWEDVKARIKSQL